MATTVMASTMSSLAFAAGAGTARVAPVHGLAPRRRRAMHVVRAQTEPDVEPTTTTSSSATPSPSPATAAAAAPKPKAAARKATPPSLRDALAFSGPAPERINGRLAMVGFVSALAVEASRGDGLLVQAGSGSGLAWFGVTAAVLSVASLVPLLRGESAEGRSGGGGLMTADAELWNGRFAMLGLVALAVTEYITGAPFVNV